MGCGSRRIEGFGFGMIDITAQHASEFLTTVAGTLDNIPQLASRVLRTKVRPYATKKLNSTLRKAPPARQWTEANPPPWTSEKQKRAYFASAGFGRGIPTKRTNRHIKSWRTRAYYKKKAGALIIYSNDPRGPFITGKWQQKFHRMAGWHDAIAVVVDDIFYDAENIFITELIEEISDAIQHNRHRG